MFYLLCYYDFCIYLLLADFSKLGSIREECLKDPEMVEIVRKIGKKVGPVIKGRSTETMMNFAKKMMNDDPLKH